MDIPPPIHPNHWARVVLGAAVIGALGYLGAALVSRWHYPAESNVVDPYQVGKVTESGSGHGGSAEQELGRLRLQVVELRQGLSKANEEYQTRLAAGQKEIVSLKSQVGSLNQQLEEAQANSSVHSRASPKPELQAGPATHEPEVSGSRRGPVPVSHVFIESSNARLEITSLEYLAEDKLRITFRYDNNTHDIVYIYGPGVRGETFVVDSLGDQYDLFDSRDLSNGGRAVPALSAVRFAVIFRAPPRETTRLSVVLRFAGAHGWTTLSFPAISMK